MKSLTIALSFILATSAMSQNATFDVTRNGTTPAMDSAIDYALDIWSNCLVSDVPIKINVNHFNMTSAGPLGITFPNGRMNFPNAPEPDTWYPTCLANAMNGTELNPGEVDMDIFMNGYWDWYLGTDGNCPADRYDFVSVFLHEIGHGLGFMSLAKVDDEKGAFGTLTALDFLPLMSSFPFPDLDGFPSVLDRYYVTPAGNRLTDTIQYQNNSTILGVLMRNNNLFYDGNWGVLTNDSTQPKILSLIHI